MPAVRLEASLAVLPLIYSFSISSSGRPVTCIIFCIESPNYFNIVAVSIDFCFKPSEKPLYLASISKVDINLYSCLACSFCFTVCIISSILLVNSLFVLPVLRYSKNSFNSLFSVFLNASAFIITSKRGRGTPPFPYGLFKSGRWFYLETPLVVPLPL
ncbi:hypothetical protein TDE_1982 [Treponema denticola ATCC 35405]|uniref:Uncharacterized protein n=1 Tax=Treponema denticola (strain ATCC 35405 / DSM 14222 / CIP 103919 / JCM 8153 / KCTC 15104) TaxID=243275 RepID=Q73L83_TREDE|nr:hypothetical protein TDE_1982 [Treponema denticola ATCC 35405]